MSYVTFVYTWSFILRPVAQSELDSGTPAAGRNEHNGFFSVVAEFRTLLSYGKVDRGPDLPRVHPGEGAGGSTPRHQSTRAGTMKRN